VTAGGRWLTDLVLYDRPVRELLEDAVKSVAQPSKPDDYVAWFVEHYPAVKETTVRMHLTAFTANDRNRRHHPNARRRPALLFKRSDGRLEPYDAHVHGVFDEFGERFGEGVGDATANPETSVTSEEDVPEGTVEFVLESYLEEFLLSNWRLLDWGRPLDIFRHHDGTDGHQFSTPIGRLDFLCRDRGTEALVAVELKRGRPSDQVVGQSCPLHGLAASPHRRADSGGRGDHRRA
jgi:hypothetical protein